MTDGISVAKRRPSSAPDLPKPEREPDWVRGDTAWSPKTPAFQDEPWRKERRMTPEAVAPYLVELRKTAESQLPERTRITPEQTTAYLEACKAKGYSTEPLEKLGTIVETSRGPTSEPAPRKRRDPAFYRRLALMFPVTEAEERAARAARAEEPDV
jgi:hypothetical protein